MAKCNLCNLNVVFCGHIHCSQSLNYFDDDGFPVGNRPVLFVPSYCHSNADVHRVFAHRYAVLPFFKKN